MHDDPRSEHGAAEIEADQIAHNVLQMPAGEIALTGPALNALGTVHGEVSAHKNERESIRRTPLPSSSGVPARSPDHVQNAIGSGGRPLDRSTRDFFEPRLGYDIGAVRVHADSAASESARAVNARAYTLGSDIVFGSGEYQPESKNGRRLLAHELAHVAQFRNSEASRLMIFRQPDGSPAGFFAQYRERWLEVTEAHRKYKTTGKIPQTRTPFSFIEIKEGRVMSRSERYDAMAKKLGLDSQFAQIDDITYDNRDPDYLTKDEYQDEYWERYHAERDQCDDDHFWPKYKNRCKRKVQEKYGGESFIAWRNQQEGAAQHRYAAVSSKVEGVVNSGFFGTMGRAAGGLIAWGRGTDVLEGSETGAAVLGLADTALLVWAGVKGGGSAPVQAPPQGMTSPPENVAPAPPKEAMPTPDDPWAPPPETKPEPEPAPAPPVVRDGPMRRAPSDPGNRAGMSSTRRTLEPHEKSTPVVEETPRKTVSMREFDDPPEPGHYIRRKPPDKSIRPQILARAGLTTDGRYRDTNTGRALYDGDMVWGHGPDFQFATMRNLFEKQGKTQAEFDAFFLDPAKWQVEHYSTNSSRVFDDIPRQRPVH